MSKSDQSFDRIARAYDLLINEPRRWANERDAIERWLEEAGERGRRVLDAGCGTGFHARHLAAHLRARVTAIDPAREMLKAAENKEHGSLVNWVKAPAESPPAGPFDLILLLGNTLSLIPSPKHVFEAIADCAVQGSLFVIQTLDYSKLRAAGPQIVIREGDSVSIRKSLTPHAIGDSAAATLELAVFDESGEAIARMTDELIDHPTDQLVTDAAPHGWHLAQQLSSYKDSPAPGPDRILVFRLQP